MSYIGIAIDAAIVLAVVIYGLVGLKRGLFKSLLALFTWSVCIIIAFYTAKYVATWINSMYDFSGLIGGKLTGSIVGLNPMFENVICEHYSDSGALISEINSIEINGAIKQVFKIVFKNANIDYATCDQTVGAVAGASLGQIAVIVASGILVFLVLKLAVFLLGKFFDGLTKSHVIGTLNRILGLVFGVVKCAVVVFVINFVLVALTLIPPVNKTVTPIINDNTKIEKIVYKASNDVFEKYVINGKVVESWLKDIWNAR